MNKNWRKTLAAVIVLLLTVSVLYVPVGSEVKAAAAAVSITESGGWNNGSDTFTMFNCTVTNDTVNTISNWKITVPVGTGATVDQSWCGVFILNNGMLTITPDANNATIAAGGNTSLGFILKNAGSFDVTKAILSYDGSSSGTVATASPSPSKQPSSAPSPVITASSMPSMKPSATPASTTGVPVSPAVTSGIGSEAVAVTASTSFHSSKAGTVDLTSIPTVSYKKKDLTSSYTDAETIRFSSSSVSYSGSKATVNGSKITISAGGSFVVTGNCSDGQIIVNTEDFVQLILNGVNLTSQKSAPIYVQNADKAVVTLAAGSSNTLSDTAAFTYTDTVEKEPGATIFSKDDLTFNGTGTLTVNATFNNAIQSKDKLKFVDGTYVINSVGDGLKGKDCVGFTGGTFTIKTSGDGIQSTNDTDFTTGFVEITGGSITINATKDGIQAESFVDIQGGSLNITTNGGSTNGPAHSEGFGGFGNWGGNSGSQTEQNDTESAKGLKSNTATIIAGGTITLNTSDDAVHSDNVVYIDGGNTTIATGDDGLHGEIYLICDSGTVNLTASYEGYEAQNIILNGGDHSIVSSDDGINGNTNSANVEINGGSLLVDANGDGLDSNNTMVMTGGTVLVSGPTSSMNGALDYERTFQISGGILVAAGSRGMAMNISSSSTQPGALFTYSSTQAAKSALVLRDSAGKDIIAFNPAKTYQTVCISTPDMKIGSSYNLYSGTANVSTMKQLSNSEYSLGNLVQSVTLSSIVTGGGTGGFPGGGRW